MDYIDVPGCEGKIGMTSMPGANLEVLYPMDLDYHLKKIKEWGTEILLSLNESKEYERYGVPELPRRIPKGILHIEMPIRDRSVPSPEWEVEWVIKGETIRNTLKRGGRVFVHCAAGHGRTGTVVARLLIEFGMTAEEAIDAVQQARPGCVETHGQEEYVREFAKKCRAGR